MRCLVLSVLLTACAGELPPPSDLNDPTNPRAAETPFSVEAAHQQTGTRSDAGPPPMDPKMLMKDGP